MKLEFDQISARLGGRAILNEVSLTARPGEITGVIGPNGCGKSTLLKTLFSIVPKQSGSIRIDGTSTDSLSRRQIASLVGYVGQDTPVVFDFSVREVVEMALYPSGSQTRRQKEAVVSAALDQMQIRHLAGRSMPNLSGGERKMVFLARTIAQGCETIILDEPTNHLDIHRQLYIMNYLKQSKKTILIVLHDLNLAAHFCDCLYLLQQGKNVASGTAQQVLTLERVRQVFGVEGEYLEGGCPQPGFYLRF